MSWNNVWGFNTETLEFFDILAREFWDELHRYIIYLFLILQIFVTIHVSRSRKDCINPIFRKRVKIITPVICEKLVRDVIFSLFFSDPKIHSNQLSKLEKHKHRRPACFLGYNKAYGVNYIYINLPVPEDEAWLWRQLDT